VGTQKVRHELRVVNFPQTNLGALFLSISYSENGDVSAMLRFDSILISWLVARLARESLRYGMARIENCVQSLGTMT